MNNTLPWQFDPEEKTLLTPETATLIALLRLGATVPETRSDPNLAAAIATIKAFVRPRISEKSAT